MTRPLALLCCALALAACEVVPKEKLARDSAADSGAAAAAGGVADTGLAGIAAADSLATDSLPDSLGAAGMDSLAAGAGDSLLLFPERPRRGGVVVAVARGVHADAPRCGWRGRTLPCYDTPLGVRALVPLPADESAMRGTLTIETRDASLRRDIGIEGRAFGRELVLLDSAGWRRVRDRSAIARDARALRQVFAAATADQRWRESWRDPVAARGKTSEYGVERFYYRASDSSRAIDLPPELRARGTFGTDSAAGKDDDVPSWRHAGVDIPAAAGSTVRAPAPAVVADVGEYILTGRTVVLDHGQGVYSAYFHLDTALVRRGDLVKQGATVARVGSTGLATGPHLHFGVYVAGRDVDPAEWRRAVEWMARQEGGGARARD